MGVENEEQMKNKQEEAPRTTMVLSVSNGQRGGGGGPINRSFSTGSGQKPVLKALPRPVALAGAKGSMPRQHLSVAIGQDPLAPVRVTNRC